MNKYMQIADEMAKKNLETNHGGPFGAVIVKNDIIVGTGNNQVIKNNDPTAHAEITAIRNACKNLKTFDLSDCVLYTSCEPCPMCLSATIWANIKIIYYGNTRYDAAEIGFRDEKIYNYLKKNDDSILKIIPMDRNETIKTFQDFHKKTKNKTMY